LLRYFFNELPNLLPSLDEAVEWDNASDERPICVAIAALAKVFAYASRAEICLTHLEPLAGSGPGPGAYRLAIRFPGSQVLER